MNKFSTPFMAKSPLPKKTLDQKIEETRKKAYMKGSPDYTDEEYEASPEERRAQRKLARLEKRKKRKEQK